MGFNVVSNSYIGTHYYIKTKIEYSTPFVGSLFCDDEMYLKFLENYEHYMNLKPEIIENYDKNIRFEKHLGIKSNYVLMKLDDIVIHWIHETSAATVLANWNRRKERSIDCEKVFVWTTSEFQEIYSDDKREVLIKRFCNIPEFTILITERKNEVLNETNSIIHYIPIWDGNKQDYRNGWGGIAWNNQKIVGEVIIDIINKR